MSILRYLKGKSLLVGFASAAIASAAGLMAATPAHADTIDWTSWTSATPGSPTGGSASGSIASTPAVTVSYTGEVESLQANYPSWLPASSYVGGTVGDAPPQSGGIIQLFGGSYGTGIDTITFSEPIVDPVMAIWSLGSANTPAEFDFTAGEPFTIEAGGPSQEYGGGSITKAGDVINGVEGNGTIQFSGTYNSISWTTPEFEDWYGFTAGIAGVAVPLPASLPMVAIGMLGLLVWQTAKSVKRQRA